MNRYTKIRDFHGSRLTGVGSSDIPVLAGLSKKHEDTPYTLWRLKTGLDAPQDAGARAEWGHRLEGLVLAKWIENRYGADTADAYLRYKAREMSVGVFKTETEARLPGKEYVLAHADLVIDGLVPVKCPKCESLDLYQSGSLSDCSNKCGAGFTVPGGVIVEAKTTGFFSGKRDDDDPDSGYSKTDRTANGIPASVFLQVQWQMLAYGVDTAYVAVLIDTGDYREYGPICADPRVQEKCLTLAERFWQCVETNTEPKPELWSDVALMWPEPTNTTAMIGGEDEMKARAMIGEYHALKAQEKETVARLAEIQNALGILIGENKTLVTAEGVKLASSWMVEQKGVACFDKLPKATQDKIADCPELVRELSALSAEKERVEARVGVVVEMVKSIKDLADAGVIWTGYRVLRPSKIKGVA